MNKKMWEYLKESGQFLDPRFKVVTKEDSKLMWFLYVVGFMWIWNKRFMTSITTTIGATVYMPRQTIAFEEWETLAHELVHVHQANQEGLLAFLFQYATSAMLRTEFETFGYGMSLCALTWGYHYKREDVEQTAWVYAGYLNSSTYLWCVPEGGKKDAVKFMMDVWENVGLLAETSRTRKQSQLVNLKAWPLLAPFIVVEDAAYRAGLLKE